MTSQSKDTTNKNGVDTVHTSEQDFAIGSQEDITALQSLQSYTWRSLFRSVLLQIILFGLLSLVGPAMSDAITNLGGGGLASPWLANLSTCLSYACSFVCTLIGGPLINKIGIKWSCFIAAVAFPLHGSAFYVNTKYGIDWYLLFGNIIQGSTGGFLYVAETTAMLSYPKPENRGLYLGIWSAMRSSGSVIGGAINFSTNYDRASAGGIAWSTYLIFVGCECTGVLWALMLSSTRNVRRRDGSKIPTSGSVSWAQEFAALWEHYKSPRTWLIFVPSFYSFFYGGTMGTYLSLHFSVRARALSSLIVPSITIPSVIVFGKLLDTKWCSQRRRAWTGISVWIPLQAACFIWIGIIYNKRDSQPVLDYEENATAWIKAYLPYLIIFVTGYWTQLQLYWILGTFSTDVKESSRGGGSFRAFETAGQAISYGLNSGGIPPQIPFYINAALLVLVVPFIVCLIRLIPEASVEVEHEGGEIAGSDRGGRETVVVKR